ncbi:MAG: dienelactone hydrolase family protein [Bacteroidales bacterium]
MMIKKGLVYIFFALAFAHIANAQQTVTFSSLDGVTITADKYVVSTQKPYLILLHQAGFSRGEYRETAPKLANLGFNCLAVDLRSGNEVNFVKNSTALDAKEKGKPCSYLDARQDITATISYVAGISKKPIILVGSSYSASLALVEATNNFKVKAVVVFSPGEYFKNELNVKEATSMLYVPVLATSSRIEFEPMKKMLDHIKPKHLTLFKPTKEGVHGSRALWESNPNHEEYWMALTQFFSQLKF